MNKKANPLPVMEHFYTLQGEGAYCGFPAYFIRLAGCDVGCVWCDVKESWNISENQWMKVEEIAEIAANSGASIVVITGGEPTMHDLSLLTKSLKEKGLRTHIETAGAHAFTGDFDWICLSPKKFLHPKLEIYAQTHELKIIIYNAHDFVWAEQEAAKCPANTQLFLQAEWSKKEKYYPQIVQFIKDNPKWRMSVQTHKYLDIP
jgi:organic radical activating enzyme